MHERIKKLRKALGLTQQELSEELNIGRGTLANYERGRNDPIDAVISLICQKFNVNEAWLRTGKGEMFLPAPSNMLDTLAKEYHLSHDARILVEEFVSLKPEMQQVFVDFARKAAESFRAVPEQTGVDTVRPEWTPEDRSGHRRTQEDSAIRLRFSVSGYAMPMSAGTGQPAGEGYPDNYYLTKEPPRGTSYIAPISGDSMEPTFYDGDKLFIHACTEINVGQIGVFFMDGQQWVKELGGGELISHNPNYPSRPITEDIVCQGLVLGVCDESYFE